MKRTYKGRGGHMDAALVHQINFLSRIYQSRIDEAWLKRQGGLASHLIRERDRQISLLKGRLQDRGYYQVTV